MYQFWRINQGMNFSYKITDQCFWIHEFIFPRVSYIGKQSIQKPGIFNLFIIVNILSQMQQKPEAKMSIHQALIKNGFYRLPMHFLSEILKTLDMPESLQPKIIQENAINGLIRVIQKYKDKYVNSLNTVKNINITKQARDYVTRLLHDTYDIIFNKSTYGTSVPMPPLLNPQTPPTSSSLPPIPPIPSMYPPMGQIPFIRPPPFSANNDSATDSSQNVRMMEEQMRIQQQQMYMYYYGMYNNYPNNMNYPQIPSYMNPYSPYSSMTNSKMMPSSLNSANNSLMNSNPLSSLNPRPSFINSQNPSGNNGGKSAERLSSSSSAAANFLKSSTQGLTRDEKTGNKQLVQDSKKPQKNSAMQAGKFMSQSPSKEQTKQDKKKNAQFLNDKPKINIQNPPFFVDASQSTKKNQSNSKQTNEPNQLLRYCACKGLQKYQQQFLCAICNRTYHYQCLSEPIRKKQMKQPIECYHCRMRFIDPLNRVKEVIGEYYISNISQAKFWISCNLKPYQFQCRQKAAKNEIEMRCLKVFHNDSNQITWPDECIIKLNNQRIIQIPALQINSSLKKRKDYSILITQNIYNKLNQHDTQSLEKIKLSLEIKPLSKEEICHKKIKNNYTFAFAIYFVQKLTVDELYHKILTEQKIPETPDYLQKLMRTTQNQIQIDKIIFNLNDPFSWDIINTPVRGHKCLHGQCFDLKTFISFMSTARNRTWKCPVCNKDARKFMIDSQQLELIKRVQEGGAAPSEVAFMKDGTIMLKMDKESDDEDNKSVQNKKLQKTKKIAKQPKPQREGDSKSNKSVREQEPDQSKKLIKQPMIDVHDIDCNSE